MRRAAERHQLFDPVRAAPKHCAPPCSQRTASIVSTACSTPVTTMQRWTRASGQVRTAFTNSLAVTAKAAELDICQIGYPTLGRSVRQALGGRA